MMVVPFHQPLLMPTRLRTLCLCLAVTAALGSAWAPAARGHQGAPDHGCQAPARPADDQNDVLWQRFLDEVDAFRACISDYAAANHRASEAHRQAANQATLDWNRFVRSDLNVPEDYPWPPEGRDQGR